MLCGSCFDHIYPQADARYCLLYSHVLTYLFAGQKVGLNELSHIDRDLAKGLQWILDNPVEELEQTITYEHSIFGKKITKELILDGYNTLVTDDNKRLYVDKICQSIMVTDVKNKLDTFIEGFYRVIPRKSIELFTASELSNLITGETFIDVDEIERTTKCTNFPKSDVLMQWLWTILRSFSQDELAMFLFFVSGIHCT